MPVFAFIVEAGVVVSPGDNVLGGMCTCTCLSSANRAFS